MPYNASGASILAKVIIPRLQRSGEQLTLHYVARLANACNVFGNHNEVAHKFAALRRHCEEVG